MRVTITIDSADAQEAHAFVCAFQRTAGLGLPPQITTEPTVRIAGSTSWTVQTPAMHVVRVAAILREWDGVA